MRPLLFQKILAGLISLIIFLPVATQAASCQDECQATADSTVSNCAQLMQSQIQVGADQRSAVADYEKCSRKAIADGATCKTGCGGGATGAPAGTVTLLNPLGLSDPRLIVGRIIKGVLSIVGTITLAMFMYGGVLWITSMGESKKVEKGKSIFVWTTLGLGIIAIAYTAVNAIMNALRTGSVT